MAASASADVGQTETGSVTVASAGVDTRGLVEDDGEGADFSVHSTRRGEAAATSSRDTRATDRLVTGNIISDLCEGVLRQMTRCRNCGFESSRDEPFKSLEVSIEGDDPIQLDVLLTNFFKMERVTWRCERCGESGDGEKRILRLPDLLIIQLKRFRRVLVGTGPEGFTEKVNTSVLFPLSGLAMNHFCPIRAAGDSASLRARTTEHHDGAAAAAAPGGTTSPANVTPMTLYDLRSFVQHSGNAARG